MSCCGLVGLNSSHTMKLKLMEVIKGNSGTHWQQPPIIISLVIYTYIKLLMKSIYRKHGWYKWTCFFIRVECILVESLLKSSLDESIAQCMRCLSFIENEWSICENLSYFENYSLLLILKTSKYSFLIV